MAFSVSYIYEIKDRYSRKLRQISATTKKFRKNVGGLQTAVAGIASGAGIYGALDAYAKWEDSVQDVNRVMNFSNKELKDFQGTLTDLSIKFAKPREGLAAIAYEGGKLGITKKKLESFIITVSKMAASFDLTDEAAGKSLGSIKTKLGLSMKQVIELTDSMNYLADTTSASGSDMVSIISRLSGEFATLGLDTKTVASWAAFANQLEVSPELAASGMGMMLRKLQAIPAVAKGLFEKPNETIAMVLDKISKIDKIARQKVIKKIFGDEAGRFVKKAAMKLELFNKTLGKGLSKKATGSMAREFENILNRTSTKIKRFKVTFTNIFADIGETLKETVTEMQPQLIKFSKSMTIFIKKNPDLIRMGLAVAGIAAAFTAIAIPISLAMPLITAIGGLIGAISAPMLAFGGTIAAIGLTFYRWVETSNPIIESLRDLKKEFEFLTEPISEFFGEFKGFGEVVKSVLKPIKILVDELGRTLALYINRLIVFIKTLKSLGKASSQIFSGDFTKAWESIKKDWEVSSKWLEEKDLKTFSKKFNYDIKSDIKNNVLPISPRENAINKALNIKDNINIEGSIKVEAAEGTKILSSDIRINRGSNMAMIGGL